MKVIFAIVGLVIGGLMASNFFGALLGLGLGLWLAFWVQGKGGSSAPAVGPSAADLQLLERVARLEDEVRHLRQSVRALTEAAPAATAPAPVAVTPAPVMQAAAAAPAEPRAWAPVPPEAQDTVLLPPDPERDTGPDTVVLGDEAAEPAPALAPPPVLAPAPARAPVPAPKRPPPPAAPPPPALPDWLRQALFGGNTIVKVGVLILFLGLAFLLRYVAERATLPIEFRYAGVALFGTGLLGLGWRLRHRRDAAGGTGYGLVLQGAGVGVLYLTTLAALKLSALLPAPLAFAFLTAVALLSVVLAVAQNAPWLAYVAVAEGLAAPVLVSTGSGEPLPLFTYLAVLDVGVALVAGFRAWRPLNVMAAAGTLALASAWAGRHYSEAHQGITQGFLLFFFALFTGVGVLFARKALAGDATQGERSPLAQRAAQALADVGRVDSALVFGVPLACFGLQYLLVRDQAFGPAWAAVGFGVFYLLLGGWLLRAAQPRFALLGEAFVIVSVLFGTLAIPLALEGEWTGATWAVEAAGMYWLGTRQWRPYARAFALLVLGAAALRVGSALSLDLTPGTPLLVGAWLGLLMTSASALLLFNIGRRHPHTGSSTWEALGLVGALWIGLAALAALPWLWLSPMWASVVTALLGAAVAGVHQHRPFTPLQAGGAALHAVALAGFASTLHAVHGAGMLANGLPGLVAALLIGASLLVSVGLPLRGAWREGAERAAAPALGLAHSLGLLAGVGLLALALLFVLPADEAARGWPWFGLTALAVGLRLHVPALGWAWAGLQLAAGAAQLTHGPEAWSLTTPGWTLWTPLSLALAAGVSGDLLRRQAAAGRPTLALDRLPLAWALVVWGWAWWGQAILPDAYRALLTQHPEGVLRWPAVLTGAVLLSALLGVAVARWRQWTVLGQSTAAALPLWALTAWLAAASNGAAPLAHGGWLVWPLVLAVHLPLLRAQAAWLAPALLRALHVGGLWLFLWLLTRQCVAWSAGWGAPGSAWALWGEVLPAVLLLVALSRPALSARWPLRDFRDPYLVHAAAPVALLLALWVAQANALAGDAAPLPYLLLLNPLELAQGAVLLALVGWRRALPASALPWVPAPAWLAVLGALALAMVTSVVLRSCHHLAGVPWEAEALFASTLAQAAVSVTWAVLGVALMLLGHRRVQRLVWAVGAALLAVVVLKLFLVELADRGGLYRIVSFIVVGLLLLLVGYFAPVPPKEGERDAPA